jgi:hypothetical protein
MAKKILMIAVLAISLVGRTYSQDFWETLYFPDSTNIYCIAVNNQGHIFVGAGNDGVAGGVYRSIDTAQSWELVLDVGTFMVQSIEINENGYIYVGRTGFDNFMVSQDNGETWEAIDLTSNNNVMKILCNGLDTIYVSLWEDNGALLIRSVNSGATWDSFFTSFNTSEYVSDVAISSTGDIYVSLMCFFFDMGGVYKSEDSGNTWEYVGLINNQVSTLEFNSNDDLFIGVWSDFIYVTGSLYALFNGANELEELLFGPSITDMVINSNDDIYFADMPAGIMRSLDNGQTFEFVNDGLSGATGIMSIDNQGYIYLASAYGSNKLARSINPTITAIHTEQLISQNSSIKIFTNPVSDILDVQFYTSENVNQIAINLYEVSGKKITKNKVNLIENHLKIEVSHLQPGIYFIEVLNVKERLTSKFIKK